MKCCEECPGDDTCEHAKVCMCGSYMDGHDAMEAGHSPVSMHAWHSQRLPDAKTFVEMFDDLLAD